MGMCSFFGGHCRFGKGPSDLRVQATASVGRATQNVIKMQIGRSERLRVAEQDVLVAKR